MRPSMMTTTVGLLSVPALSGVLVIVLLKMSAVARKVDGLDERTHTIAAEAASLDRETAALDMQMHGVAMLYQAAASGGADQRVVSPDGSLVMFTWRDAQTHKLCAHWCAVADSGECATFGPDRCMP